MAQLNRKVAGLAGLAQLPERVLQFGEGNFLRAFVDWKFHQLNKQGLFNGSVVVVQPIAEGLVPLINEQEGLFTLLLRGLQDGKPLEQTEVISSISRGLNPYTQWDEYLRCAEERDIEFVVSNTTEAGITYDANDQPDMTPPASFPAKLAVYLYHRYCHFQGDPAAGLVILPCELIDRNGDNLKAIVLRLAREWQWPQEFSVWINEHNYFLNTLVDRVVTGYPRDEVAALTERLGYEDKLLNAGELFHLWVIEGPAHLAKRLPFVQAGLNVVWTEDMAPYRTRKVRILNGGHTASVPAAFLYGLETVGEMMDHDIMGAFVRQAIYDEIVPSIKLDKVLMTDFANSVVERFQNPFIKHYLLSILLNSSSKFKTRVLPSILEYQEQYGQLPEKLVFSLAALISVYKDGVIEGTVMRAQRTKGAYEMKDDVPVLEFLAGAWSKYDNTTQAALTVSKVVLGNTAMWGRDLNQVPGLTEKTADYLYRITSSGIQAVAEQLVRR
jgi:tagaturonate reductase